MPEPAWFWVPRVVLFPLYAASEFLVRRPLGLLVTFEEKYHWRERYHDLLTFGPEQQVGIFPTGRLDVGQRLTVGAFAYWNDIVRSSDLRLRAVTGGERSWNVAGAWRYRSPEGARLAATATAYKLPDRSFHGFGPRSSSSGWVYEESAVDVRAAYAAPLVAAVPPLEGTLYAGHLWKAYQPGLASVGKPALSEAIASGQLDAPPALEDGFSTLYAGLGIALDTRGRRLTPSPHEVSDFEHRSGSGLGVDARVRMNQGLRSTRAAAGDARATPRWLAYGGSLDATLDLTGTQRRLDATLAVAFADALPGAGAIPFSELVWLGGAHPLRGFRDHRLVDRSAAVGTLTYRWPIWVYLDGNLHYAVGNVFGAQLAGFEPELLRSSFGIGVSSAASSDNPFEALLALGTRPFQDGGGVESVRFVFGTSAGF
ncbi:MAG TPA: hypothetical protein VMG12_42980 [Polyangiaceae bacterium]|nr:hypothetical protein [Polyangiaceae bacterium]